MEWFTPHSSRGNPKKDVNISCSETSAKTKILRIRFSAQAKKNLASGRDHVQLGLENERLYFKPTSDNGFKLTCEKGKHKESYRLFIRDVRLWGFLQSRKGGYDLKFDVNKKMHYVQLEKKEAD